MIQLDLTDRPFALLGIINKILWLYAVSLALVTVEATDVIVKDQQQSKISKIVNNEIIFETEKSNDTMTLSV